MIETFRKPGRWLRVNTHAHTVNSDGTYTPEEAVARYRDTLRYHALAITDHRHATPVDGLVADGEDFCVIPGNELDGVDPETGMYHLVALGVTDHQDFGKALPCRRQSIGSTRAAGWRSSRTLTGRGSGTPR
ncbi:MAG: hypothetical protein M5R40_24625 [Anaerolineae bacterium]|nr:hypothetical protein [Anaerolineae bacterium]